MNVDFTCWGDAKHNREGGGRRWEATVCSGVIRIGLQILLTQCTFFQKNELRVIERKKNVLCVIECIKKMCYVLLNSLFQLFFKLEDGGEICRPQ